jgi:sorbitol-specific phosphotransferase system component IIC
MARDLRRWGKYGIPKTVCSHFFIYACVNSGIKFLGVLCASYAVAFICL